MRQFKFRVWDKDKKIFLSDYDFCIYDGAAIRIEVGGTETNSFGSSYNPLKLEENDLGGIYLDKNLLVQQFTGLQDSEGKDIFEGDIVEISTNYQDYSNSRHGLIHYKACRYLVGVYDSEYSKDVMVNDNYCPIVDLSRECRVAGNIFEHFALLFK